MDAFAVPPQGPPAPQQWIARPTGQPVRLRPLSVALSALLPIVALACLLAAVLLLFRAYLVSRVLDGRSLDPDVAEATDSLVIVFGVLQVLLMLVIGVVFLVWQHRHARNAQLLGSQSALGPEWAVGGWFIPVANFVLPGMQIFTASRFSDLSAAAAPGRRGRGAPIVVGWAVALGLGWLLAVVGVKPVTTADFTGGARQLAAADRIGAVGELVLVVAAVLAMIMVRTLSRRQEQAIGTAWQYAPVPPARPGAPTWGGVPGSTPWPQPQPQMPQPQMPQPQMPQPPQAHQARRDPGFGTPWSQPGAGYPNSAPPAGLPSTPAGPSGPPAAPVSPPPNQAPAHPPASSDPVTKPLPTHGDSAEAAPGATPWYLPSPDASSAEGQPTDGA
ncbi:MAG TPA: DUF4328 domain-containing protein, partial [Jiangellaceae bacterium]